MVMLLKKAFNIYMLLCGNNALKQKAVHSSMACYVHVLLYNAAKQTGYVLTLRSFCNSGNINNDFYFYILLCSIFNNTFLSNTLHLPVILDGQLSSIHIQWGMLERRNWF
jgi:hypothetical protein